MTDSIQGPSSDTLAGDIVILSVPLNGPYGVNFVPDQDGCAAIVKSFDKLPNGKFGPIQKHGGIHYGDVLFEINDISLMNTPYKDAIMMVNDRNTLKKTFKFINSREYYRKKRGVSTRINENKNNFLSTIKRTRFSEEASQKFVEYEIACQLRTSGGKVQKEIVYQWSVWRRYSAFKLLHEKLIQNLGWQMNGIEFPSPYTFTFNKFSPDFVNQRKDEFKAYWQRVVSIEKITDFLKHHCSSDLKEFLDVDTNIKQEVAASADMVESPSNTSGDDLPYEKKSSFSSAPVRKPVKSLSNRRLSGNYGIKTVESSSGKEDQSSSPARQIQPESSISPPSRPPPPPRPTSPLGLPVSNSNPFTPPPPPAPTISNITQVPPPVPTSSTPPPPPLNPESKPSSTANLPPKPSGARANLLSSINSLRKE